MAQASSLTVAELDEQLDDLVDWETFGTHLRKIKSKDIEIIERLPSVHKQKFALYRKWLKVCPDATWSDVVIALEKAQEFTLAEQVKSLRNNQQCDGRQKEIVIPLEEEDAVINELEHLHSSYRALFTRTREHIEELVETKQLTLHRVASRLEDAFHSFSVKGLTKCKLITEIFDILREHSHFLDGSVLKIVIDSVIGKSDLLQEAIEHYKRVQQFKIIRPIQILKEKLKKSEVRKNHILLTIRLNELWGNIHIN